MVTTKTAMGEEQFKLYQEKEDPDPQSILRLPTTYEPKPQVTLADPDNMILEEQNWKFDFSDLSLSHISSI